MNKMIAKRCFWIGLMTLLLIHTPFMKNSLVSAEEEGAEEQTHYLGEVTNRVNVRTGPGESNERLTYNGEYVQMSPGDTVVIIGEEMVGSKPWYQIEIDMDGEIIIGYSTSSYITKTDTVVTPIPEPTLEPTPEPTLEPTPEPTEEAPGPSVTQAPLSTAENSSIGDFILPIMILIVAGGICAAVLVMRKMHSAAESSEMTNAVKRLTKANAEGKNAPHDKKGRGRKVPEVKSSKNFQKENAERSLIAPGVYVIDEEDEFAAVQEDLTEDELKAEAYRENDEKKKIRKEIDSLIEHDIVEHKFFGKGEVFDNSDVKLIEVRFGNDVRFLNKDALVMKKLLKKSTEGNTRWNI